MEIKNIPFDNGELLGAKDENDNVYLAVKKACLDIGLTDKQADNEVKKVQENLLFEGNHLKFEVVQTEGKRQVSREVVGLLEKFVPIWLAQINLTPAMKKNNSKAVNKLFKYQLEASDVLHNAFMETEEQKQEFYNELGLEGQIIELKDEVIDLRDKVSRLIDSSTINYRQAQKLLHACKDRVSEMLGGAHSEKYKKFSRMYFKNLWLNFGESFEVSSYKDLNPTQIDNAYTFITRWSMV